MGRATPSRSRMAWPSTPGRSTSSTTSGGRGPDGIARSSSSTSVPEVNSTCGSRTWVSAKVSMRASDGSAVATTMGRVRSVSAAFFRAGAAACGRTARATFAVLRGARGSTRTSSSGKGRCDTDELEPVQESATGHAPSAGPRWRNLRLPGRTPAADNLPSVVRTSVTPRSHPTPAVAACDARSLVCRAGRVGGVHGRRWCTRLSAGLVRQSGHRPCTVWHGGPVAWRLLPWREDRVHRGAGGAARRRLRAAGGRAAADVAARRHDPGHPQDDCSRGLDLRPPVVRVLARSRHRGR